ncbi:MAG: mechanosensitive ion channel family protein [Bacteroidales bacterium]|nr:mechanosensitive ion channel family protein [Bacteroidales bacterium]
MIDTRYIKYAVLILVCLALATVISKLTRMALNRFFKSSSAVLKVDPTRFSFVKNTLTVVIYLGAVIVIFYSIPELKAVGLSLFAGAGIIAAIVGFASQQAFSNIVSGVFIVIFKPFRVGDNVKINEMHQGIVEDITLRHTVIRNFENRRVIIPNAVINSETVVNSTIVDEKVCVFLELGISYDADIDKAMQIMQEEALRHPLFLDNRTPEEIENNVPPVRVRVTGFSDSSVNLRAWIWAGSSADGFDMKCDLHKSVKEQFDRQGIEIPFPYRTVVFKSGKPEIPGQ